MSTKMPGLQPGGRTRGAVFLTGRQARTPLAAADLDPATGRARLSYPRAEEIFNEMTKALAHPDITDPPSSPTHLDGRCTS